MTYEQKKLDRSLVTVIMFDLFGTILDTSKHVTKDELRNYGRQLERAASEGFFPLCFQASFLKLREFPGTAEALYKLGREFKLVTCSNAPLWLQLRLIQRNALPFHALTPVELFQVYKPNCKVYLETCALYGISPSKVLFVTGNEHFGDLEAAQALGMQTALIHTETGNGFLNLGYLAKELFGA